MSRGAISVTLDVDWAPDFVIDEVADRLLRKNIPATWFVTHSSPAIEKLRRRPDLFELGIHPNFLPNSSQGVTESDVLEYMMEIVPEAATMRSHAVVQSGPLLARVMDETPIRVDSTLFLPEMPNIVPVNHLTPRGVLRRVPFFWADDYEMLKDAPHWDATHLLSLSGCKVFMFHPIHVYLNSFDLDVYSATKSNVGCLTDATAADLESQIHDGTGVGDMFERLIESVPVDQAMVVREIADLNANRP